MVERVKGRDEDGREGKGKGGGKKGKGRREREGGKGEGRFGLMFCGLVTVCFTSFFSFSSVF